MSNRNLLSLRSFASSLKKNLFEIWFYTFFFHDFIHVYSPEQVLTTPWGRNFYINRNILSLWSYVASSKKISLKSDFIQLFFHDFIHVYSPVVRADNPQGTKFWCQQKCHFFHLLQVSKQCLWSLILYNSFQDLIHVHSPGARADSPPGDKILMSTERPYHFTNLLQVPKKFLKSDFIQFFSWFNTGI